MAKSRFYKEYIRHIVRYGRIFACFFSLQNPSNIGTTVLSSFEIFRIFRIHRRRRYVSNISVSSRWTKESQTRVWILRCMFSTRVYASILTSLWDTDYVCLFTRVQVHAIIRKETRAIRLEAAIILFLAVVYLYREQVTASIANAVMWKIRSTMVKAEKRLTCSLSFRYFAVTFRKGNGRLCEIKFCICVYIILKYRRKHFDVKSSTMVSMEKYIFIL